MQQTQADDSEELGQQRIMNPQTEIDFDNQDLQQHTVDLAKEAENLQQKKVTENFETQKTVNPSEADDLLTTPVEIPQTTAKPNIWQRTKNLFG